MATQRTDQDTPWKLILEQYFQDCIQFFFPQAHAEIDWSHPYEFLDKELQKITRDAIVGRQYADKLARVWLASGTELWVLLHVEVQGKPEPNFAQRMYRYNHRIADRYDRPVASMAILCDATSHWRPNQYLENMLGCQISFRFLTTKLLDYQHQWVALEQNPNPFATVVMAHLKNQATRRNQQERKTWKLYLIRRLYEQGYQREQVINLFTFIDWLMVLPEGLEQEVWQTLQDYEQEKRMPYVTSVERIGIEKGRQEGIQEGRQEGIQEGRQEGIQEGAHQQALKSLLRILQRRFEHISIPLQRRLQKLTTEQLEGLIDCALTSASLREFTANVPKVNRTSHKTGQKPEAVTTVSKKRIPPRFQ